LMNMYLQHLSWVYILSNTPAAENSQLIFFGDQVSSQKAYSMVGEHDNVFCSIKMYLLQARVIHGNQLNSNMVSLDLDQEPKVCEDLEEFTTTTWPQVLLLEGVQWMQYVPKCEKGLVTVINWDTDVFVSLKSDELQQLQI
jgi:hypothetical protein